MKSILTLSIAALTFMGCTQNHTGDKYDTNPAEMAASPNERDRRNSETNAEFAKRMEKMPTRTPGENHPALSELADSTTSLGNSFAVKLTDVSLAEISFSELAMRKTKNQKILDFAQKIRKDYTAASQELKTMASEEGVELPTSCASCMSAYKSLHELGTVEFNRQYVEMVITDHERAVRLLNEEVAKGDPGTKAWAEENLALFQNHLTMARNLMDETGENQKAVGKKAPGKKVDDRSGSAQSDDKEDRKSKRKNKRKNRKAG